MFAQVKLARRRTGRLALAAALFLLTVLIAARPVAAVANPTTTIFINEIHYDNAGTDTGEAVEVAGPAGTDLTGWTIVLYNGSNGTVYDTEPLSGLIPDQQGGYGTVALLITGIQNGAPDGIALVDAGGTLVQFLSYEGAFTGIGGAADGLASTDIGVSQTSSTPVGASLQLVGSGATYGEFIWTATDVNSFGNPNAGQTFGAAPPPDPLFNEFSASTTGTDVEYVEIIGAPGADYAAYSVLEIEGDSTGPGVIDEIISLGTTGANGLYLADLAANTLENGTITLLLVRNFSGTIGADLDTDNDGVLDATPWDAIVDAVAVTDGGSADFTYGIPALGPNYDGVSSFAPGGASRIPDGFDTDAAADWVRNDFNLAGIPGFDGTPDLGEALNTPGMPNQLVQPQLVINEIDYDQPGADTAEFVEIRNNGAAPIDLSGYTLELVNGSGGGAFIYDTIALSGSLAGGDYYVVCANPANVANCDLDVASIQNGAPDAVGLRYNGDLVDAVSYEGDTPGYTEGSGAGLEDPGTTGNDNLSISRCPDGADSNQNNVDFSLRTSTPGAANICVDDVPPTVASTNPADGAPDAAIQTNIDINFSEDVAVSGAWFDISCSLSGAHTATVAGGPQSYELNPDVDFVSGDLCSVTILAAGVADLDGTPENMAADYAFSFTALDVCILAYTPAYDIQGSGPAAAITGAVTTQGVVVGDYEGPSPALRGFYLQDMSGDGDPATSDAIFVFNFNNDNVNLGDVVRVSGSAGEFQDQTQISSVSSIANCGTGSVAPVDVTLPAPSADYLEQFEGMLVRFPQTLFVTEHFQLGRFGQVVMSSGARLAQPTNVVAPGAPALALQAQNDLNRIIVDDALNEQNPDPILFGRNGQPLSAANTLRGGDTATDTVGVLSYTWAGNGASGNAYRLRPFNALTGFVNFEAANPRPAAPEPVGGTLRVVGFNLLNFFNTFDGSPDTTDNCTNGVGGAAADCRGADTLEEFDRQWPKTVAAILAIDPDVLGVNEIENDGYGPNSAIAFLVDQLNAATAPGTYAFVDFDAATGQINALGTDAIKVGLIYKPASVSPVGTTAALNSVAFVNGGDTEPRNRATFAQAFAQPDGATFIVSVNHLKSKGSACEDPDAGDGQANCSVVRTNAANELADWLAADPTGTGDSDILILGDLNSYAMEDPITALFNMGYTNLISTFLGPDAYSFVFDGQWGYLDHAMASATLAGQVTGVSEYHINADEPGVLDYNTNFKSDAQIADLYASDEFRVSDHDPIIIGLNLNSFDFSGFFSPVDNLPMINDVKAGSSVPIKFSLGGDQGLAIFAAGYPRSVSVDCSTGDPYGGNDPQPAQTPGNSSLSYDGGSDQYHFNWKTDKSWSGTCRAFQILLVDGTTHVAVFRFR